jgi:hypothetical protein
MKTFFSFHWSSWIWTLLGVELVGAGGVFEGTTPSAARLSDGIGTTMVLPSACASVP